VVAGETSWNPAESIADYRQGRITTRTDSIFAFTAYKNVAGVGVRKNRQAFFIAAIDDNGVIDPFPAAVEFVATIGELPQMRFVIYPDGTTPRPYRNLSPPADTVGMFKPFAISYHGFTTNGQIRGYQYFPLSSTITIPGQDMWTEDLTDTLRTFPNTGDEELPAGVFKFAARTIDDANAESQVDAGQFRQGVAQVVVNFDPDTWIIDVRNTTYAGTTPTQEVINFADGVPDTVPYASWTYYQYNSLDDTRDSLVCSVADPADKCIDFQIKYIVVQSGGSTEDSGWLPRNGRHDSTANSATDSNSVSMGSVNYQWFVRGIDENGTADGTPPSFGIVGNFRPIFHTATQVDGFGDQLDLARIDTMTWDFDAPTSYDSTDVPGFNYEKRWSWTISGSGRDNPSDPVGSSIKAWRYYAYTNYVPTPGNDPGLGTLIPEQIGRAGDSWFAASSLNAMTDRYEIVVRYNNVDGSDIVDRSYFNKVVTLVLYGRDSVPTGGGEFLQKVYWDAVPPNQAAGSGVSASNVINTFSVAPNGRETPKKVWSFYLKFER
jgi:hypothetical protein